MLIVVYAECSVSLIVVLSCHHAACHYAEWHYSERHYAESRWESYLHKIFHCNRIILVSYAPYAYTLKLFLSVTDGGAI
jgi:hypothetical protein